MGVCVKRIVIIATTVSGSLKDWKKIDAIEPEFQKYFPEEAKLHVVDTHDEARAVTRRLVEDGSQIIVSAGGAGTFNSVLEGCYTKNGIPEGLRLAFLRKGSADLLGKVLKVPDDLPSAVQTISKGIEKDKYISADIIEAGGQSLKGDPWKRHFIGFGGVGIFGDVPYFTESRVNKYYKGILGSLFGDRGPFFVGVNLAILKHYIDGLLGKLPKFGIVIDEKEIPPARYNSIVIMNGDLGKDFPLAPGAQLDSGDFKVVILKELGPINTYNQLIQGWKGKVYELGKKLGIESHSAQKELKVNPHGHVRYMVNLDGLLVNTVGPTQFRIASQVKLITG
jgi:diacylglycerol kinase family enzyme